MAVAFDAASGTTGSNVASISWTHTPAGTPTGVGIGCAGWFHGFNSVTSVTYGGNACTNATSTGWNSAGDYATLWYIGNPPSGAQTVVINCSNDYPCGFAISVTGGDTSTVFSNTNQTMANSGTAVSLTCTSATGELVMDIGDADISGGTTATVGAGQTDKGNVVNATNIRGFNSIENGAASVTMSWTLGVSAPWTIVVGSFKASTAPAFVAYVDWSGHGDVTWQKRPRGY